MITKKNIMWYIKFAFEAIMIFVFIACLIGLLVSLILLLWNKEIANIIMGFSVCIGFVNALLSFSWEWR